MRSYKVSFLYPVDANQNASREIILRQVSFSKIEEHVRLYLEEMHAVTAEPVILKAEVFETEIVY
jgi:hypothetical protein